MRVNTEQFYANFRGVYFLEKNHPFYITYFAQWQNLKNLSGGLNLSDGLIMVGST